MVTAFLVSMTLDGLVGVLAGALVLLVVTLYGRLRGETQRKLLAAFGLPEAIFAAGREAVRSVVGKKADLLFDFSDLAAVDRNIAWGELPAQRILTLGGFGLLP